MTRLHFQPIQGKALHIIGAILQTEQVASLGDEHDIIRLAVEELVVNIVDYAGSDYLDVEIVRDEKHIMLRFRDNGVPFNPLEKDDPDITLPAKERPVGGLGIYLCKQMMDSISYRYEDGNNVLVMTKRVES